MWGKCQGRSACNAAWQWWGSDPFCSSNHKDLAIDAAATIHVMQFNAGLVCPKLDEIQSRLAQEWPDVIFIQEDWIQHDIASILHVPHSRWLHVDQSVVQSSSGEVRGSGVSILIYEDHEALCFSQLPYPILPAEDHTTEVM